MANCKICKKKIEITFLGKIIGTTIRHNGKVITICPNCQKAHNNDRQKLLDA